MKVIKCGAIVQTKLTGIQGIITAACIRFNYVEYELSYFNNGEHLCVWLHESEIIEQRFTSQNIGFINTNNKRT